MSKPPYIGRFAPSPTGPLHFGSLLAAVASYLEARRHGGQWLLRVEDIDPPRAQAGASESILRALEAYGFDWDGPVTYQNHSLQAHLAALDTLRQAGLSYPCRCSRRDLQAAQSGSLGIIYPGTCRNGTEPGEHAVRIRTDDKPLTFVDELQGAITQRLESESGDFVIHRRDGLIAYHLAVVVDDYLQGITHVVRGIDLIDSTPRQIYLQRLLGYPTPAYAHLPVATNARGQKLSKSHGAQAVSLDNTAATLFDALAVLRQAPPAELAKASLEALWSWAREHWNISSLKGLSALPVAAVANARSAQNSLTAGP